MVGILKLPKASTSYIGEDCNIDFFGKKDHPTQFIDKKDHL
jgi:hypothetical protein